MALSDSLGAVRWLELPQGDIGYRERGDGPPVLFVHGLLVNADLWRGVVPLVADAGYRCLAPDWPLGSHSCPMNRQADLSPPGLAHLLPDAHLVTVADSGTFIPEDQPTALAGLIVEFAGSVAAAR